MRLTLRTLLAWRDGLLTGAEQEELSARVSDGSVARGLLDRMEQVEQRVDVEPPKVDGRGLAADANTVAEYLENVLPAESLEAFERICLESDRHLAEVSACHAVLADTSSVRASAAVSTTPLVKAVAARLAAGGVPRQPAPPQGRSKTIVAEPTAAPQIRLAPETTSQPTARRQRGKERSGSPWLQVVVAMGLLCVAGGGLGVVLWWNPGSREAEQVAQATQDASVPAGDDTASLLPMAATVESVAAPEPVEAEVGNGGPVSDLAGTAPQTADDGDLTPAVLVPAAPPAAPEPPAASGPPLASASSPSEVSSASALPPLGTGPSVPMGGALAIAAPLAPAPDAVLPPVPAPEPPEVDPSAGGVSVGGPTGPAVPSLGVVAVGPIVLMAERDQPGIWRGCFPGESLPAGIQLLAPPAAQPELNLGGVIVRLAPRSQVVLRPSDAGAEGGVDLELVFGAATLRRITGDVVATVRAGRLHWKLSGPPSAVDLDVVLGRAPGGDPGSDGFVTARITAVAGGASWKPLEVSATPVAMPAGGLLREGTTAVWTSASAGDVSVVPAAAEEQPPVERLAAAAAEQLAEAIRSKGDVVQAARLLAADRRVECREVAGGTLALIGDYTAAAALLSADATGERLGERRWRAFERRVVPLALARGVHSAERWRQSLQALLGAEEGERAYRMAVGFSDSDLTDGGAAELVAALDDSRLVIRRYAALRLEEILDAGPRERLRYRADAAADLRADGVRWWTGQFEKGLIQRANAGQLSGRDAG